MSFVSACSKGLKYCAIKAVGINFKENDGVNIMAGSLTSSLSIANVREEPG